MCLCCFCREKEKYVVLKLKHPSISNCSNCWWVHLSSLQSNLRQSVIVLHFSIFCFCTNRLNKVFSGTSGWLCYLLFKLAEAGFCVYILKTHHLFWNKIAMLQVNIIWRLKCFDMALKVLTNSALNLFVADLSNALHMQCLV